MPTIHNNTSTLQSQYNHLSPPLRTTPTKPGLSRDSIIARPILGLQAFRVECKRGRVNIRLLRWTFEHLSSLSNICPWNMACPVSCPILTDEPWQALAAAGVISREAFVARQHTPPAASTPPPAASTPPPVADAANGPHIPASDAPKGSSEPRSSVIACGGRPGTEPAIRGYDPTFAPYEPSAIRWQLHVATMTSAHAAKIAPQVRRADEAKRRVKATEARAAEIAQGFLGALQLLLNARLTAR
jgi:hypothetical protein